MPRRLICVTGLMLCCATAIADRPALPRPKITLSASQRHFFVMLPDHRTEQGDATGPAGAAYELLESGSFRQLWTVSGWYAITVFLSDDGEHLVRMGNWAEGHELSKDDLAVAFYKKGMLLKQYSTADLVKDATAIRRTVSHYNWQACEEGMPRLTRDNRFSLKTIDGVLYTFDVTDGSILRISK